MVTVVVTEFSVMRCQPLRRALYSPSFRKPSVRIECALSLAYNRSTDGMYPYTGGVYGNGTFRYPP